jgi:PIN domain nuclease of toxin-antitoxin system
MNLIFDTHLLLWAIGASDKLPSTVRTLLSGNNHLWFSVVNVWEVAIKVGLGRDSAMIPPSLFRETLLQSGYRELPILSAHALATVSLPSLHGDPFDRMLIAQATTEGMLLLTSDVRLSQYPGPVRLV